MLARVFKIRDRRIFLHFHDAPYNKSLHPHAAKGAPGHKGGQFVAKGSGGGGAQAGPAPATAKTKPTTTAKSKPKATLKKTPRTPRGQASAGFLPLEKGEKGWTLPGGAPLPAHVQAVGIPPGWTQVRYNPDPEGALVATGRDSKDRLQPRYSAKHKKSQAANKYNRTQRLEGNKYETLTAKNNKNKSSNDPRIRDLSSALSLVALTGMRPGGDADTKADYKSYGATTLEGRHIITEDGKTIARFVSGKNKGNEIDMVITDPEIAKDLIQRAKQAGPNGRLFPRANAAGLLKYTRSLAGAGFKTKDFRTLFGTKIATAEVAKMPIPKTPAEYKKFCKAVATVVASHLGNTPPVCLDSYIGPHVFAEWKLASGA